MGRRPAVERIELIDPREVTTSATAFTSTAPAPAPSPGRPARRWARVAAPLALVAIIAGVAVAVAVTDDDSTTAPAPTTVTAPVTSAAPPTAPAPRNSAPTAPNRPARLIGTLPTGFSTTDAYEYGPDDSSAPGAATSAALWADGADDSAGARYVRVVAAADRSYDGDVGTLRVATPLGPAVASVHRGTTSVTGPTRDGWTRVQGAGLTLDEAVHVLETARVTDDRIVTGGVAVPAGLHLVGRSDGSAVSWSPLTQTRASSGPVADPTGARWLTVDVGPLMTAYQQTIEWFFMGTSRTVDIAGVQATLGTSGAEPDRQLSFDRDGLHVVVSAGGLDDADIVAFARTLHVADDASWRAIVDRPPAAVASTSDYTLTPCASGTLPGPVAWSAKCAIDQSSPRQAQIELDMSTPNGPLFATSTVIDASAPSIAAAATDRLSYVTAAVPPGVTGAVLQVLVGGDVVASSSFTGSEPADVQFAVTAFTELEPYTAQIVAADGSVLATYDPVASDTT